MIISVKSICYFFIKNKCPYFHRLFIDYPYFFWGGYVFTISFAKLFCFSKFYSGGAPVLDLLTKPLVASYPQLCHIGINVNY